MQGDIFGKTNSVATSTRNNVATTQKASVAVHSSLPTTTQNLLAQVVDYAKTSGELLDDKTKSLALDIIQMTNEKILASDNLTWNNIDVTGCNLPKQIKYWSSLGLNPNDGLWVDIRKSKNKPNMMNITIKAQYQSLEKLIVKYFAMEVLRFKQDIICVGDELTVEEDFETGLDKITKHVRNENIDRNKLDNIIGAYKIMYVKDANGNLHHYLVRIDKNRIMRAYNASSSKEKTIWLQDTRKMVLKTVTWELWNDANIRAFLKFDEKAAKNISILEESEEMEWNNNEREFNSTNEAQNSVKNQVSSEEPINVNYEDFD